MNRVWLRALLLGVALAGQVGCPSSGDTEQGDRFLTVQTLSASADQSCTLSEVGSGIERSVMSCFVIRGDHVDIAIPRSELPP